MWSSDRPACSQLFVEVSAEMATPLDEQRLLDGLVGHAQLRPVRVQHLEVGADLLRAPPQTQSGLHLARRQDWAWNKAMYRRAKPAIEQVERLSLSRRRAGSGCWGPPSQGDGMSTLSPRAAARTATAVVMAAGLAVCLSAGTAQGSPPGVPDRLGSDKDRVILQAPDSAAEAATLSLSAKAPRLVGGAAARVTAKYNCPSGTMGHLELRLTEVTGRVVAQGHGSNVRPLICDGTARSMKISVVVSNDYPFKKGKAFGQGFLYSFSETEGGEATAAAERVIKIT